MAEAARIAEETAAAVKIQDAWRFQLYGCAILTEFFLEYPVLVVPEAITDPQPVIVSAAASVASAAS